MPLGTGKWGGGSFLTGRTGKTAGRTGQFIYNMNKEKAVNRHVQKPREETRLRLKSRWKGQ